MVVLCENVDVVKGIVLTSSVAAEALLASAGSKSGFVGELEKHVYGRLVARFSTPGFEARTGRGRFNAVAGFGKGR